LVASSFAEVDAPMAVASVALGAAVAGYNCA
jgi:hypothetical protein